MTLFRKPRGRRKCSDCKELYPERWMTREGKRFQCWPSCDSTALMAHRMRDEIESPVKLGVSLAPNSLDRPDFSG